jgi:flagellar protein FlaI
VFERFRPGDTTPSCGCRTSVEGDVLQIDAADCAGQGILQSEPECRATAVDGVSGTGVSVVVTSVRGTSRRYEGRGVDVLRAASRAAVRFRDRDDVLAQRARCDPLGAAREASGRAGTISRIAADAGLTTSLSSYDAVFKPMVGPTIAGSRVTVEPPETGTLAGREALPTGGIARRYDRADHPVDLLFLEPAGTRVSPRDRATLAAGASALASGDVDGGSIEPARAIRDSPYPIDGDPDELSSILRKHTQGFGVLEDLFAIDGLTDVFAPAPVVANDLVVTIDGETVRSNVRLTESGAEALASRLRMASGRAFSRATPTLDAGIQLRTSGGRVRATAVRSPVCDGPGFAIRAHATDPWTLPRLVSNETISARLAAVLSLSVERGASILVAGSRGAGKTTLLGALMWTLPTATRIVVLEDTPELPIGALQDQERNVQPLRTDSDAGIDTSQALRTALRLGEGALVLGEVRGEEAAVLYEAMRVGANASAVLGTIHGDGAGGVRRRVTDDLSVAPTAFVETDLVVTCELASEGKDHSHRVGTVSEVYGPEQGDNATLFDAQDAGPEPTGRVRRGNSTLVGTITEPDETYNEVLERLDSRESWYETLVNDAIVSPASVCRAHALRRIET